MHPERRGLLKDDYTRSDADAVAELRNKMEPGVYHFVVEKPKFKQAQPKKGEM